MRKRLQVQGLEVGQAWGCGVEAVRSCGWRLAQFKYKGNSARLSGGKTLGSLIA